MTNELKQHAVDIYNCMSNVPKTEKGGKLALEYIENKLEIVRIIGELAATEHIRKGVEKL